MASLKIWEQKFIPLKINGKEKSFPFFLIDQLKKKDKCGIKKLATEAKILIDEKCCIKNEKR